MRQKNKKNEPGVKGLSHHHSFYYQIQGQLHITQRDFWDFVVFTLKGIDIQRIQWDDTFWSTNMEPFLLRFYMECMLPEIADPREPRSMPLREPHYILDSSKIRDEN
ncbi:unnamed protein product [Ixodes pacificus]